MHLTNDILRAIAANSVGVSGLLLMSPELGARELLASAVLLLAVLIGTVCLVRTRAARRWSAALNANSDRRIARAREDTRPKRDGHLVYIRNRWPIRPEPSFGPSPL